MDSTSSAQNNAPWEDTAIAKSWDRVVDDYKIFHDVRARGRTVDDLPASLTEAPAGLETSQDAKPETNRKPAQEGAHGGVMAADDGGVIAAVGGQGAVTNSTVVPATSAEASTPAAGTNGQASSTAASHTLPVPGLLSPHTVLGGADDGLKKLLMSWYYAGYYTGLYEGQQQAAATQQQPQPQAQASPDGHGAQARVPAQDVDVDLEDGQEMQQ